MFVINQGKFHQMEIVSAPLAASADGKLVKSLIHA